MLPELRTRKLYLVETVTDVDKDGKHTGVYRPLSFMASRSLTEAEISALQREENGNANA